MNDYTKPLVKSFVTKIFEDRKSLGVVSCEDVCETIKTLLSTKESINIIFAAAPSQLDFLNNFCNAGVESGVDFSRINAFHMDEYIGLPKSAPQGFGEFLKRHLFSRAGFKSVSYINGNAEDIEAECTRYENLIKENRPDIVCLGIGENGHIAFNDPGFAKFDDERLVKTVLLDDICRQQQVNDKCFDSLDLVPQKAVTLTIPALTNAPYHFCIVPSDKKADAVRKTLYGEISEDCPATALRKCDNVILYIDKDSGGLLYSNFTFNSPLNILRKL